MRTRIGIAVLLLIVAVSPADARRGPKLGFAKSAGRAVTGLIRGAHHTESVAEQHAATLNAATPAQVDGAATTPQGAATPAPVARAKRSAATTTAATKTDATKTDVAKSDVAK